MTNMNTLLRNGKDQILDFKNGDNFDHTVKKIITNYQATFTKSSTTDCDISSLKPPSTPLNARHASTRRFKPNVESARTLFSSKKTKNAFNSHTSLSQESNTCSVVKHVVPLKQTKNMWFLLW